MSHSLISRFHGALLGLALGEGWDRATQTEPRFTDRLFKRPIPLLFSAAPNHYPESLPSQNRNIGEIAIEMMKHLIQIQMSSSSQKRQSPLTRLNADATASQLAIGTLPIQLFCHENSKLLDQHLSQILSLWPRESAIYQQVLVIGLAMGQILKKRFQHHTFIPSLQQELAIALGTPPNDSLLTGMEMVQALLMTKASLQTALDQLTAIQFPSHLDPTIALAFYCFLSTPEDLQLALLRSARLSHQIPHLSALTGILSGTHNTVVALPLEWQLALTDPEYPLIGQLAGGEIRNLATQLLAVWSGAEDAQTFSDAAPAIAAPGVIRPMEYR